VIKASLGDQQVGTDSGCTVWIVVTVVSGYSAMCGICRMSLTVIEDQLGALDTVSCY